MPKNTAKSHITPTTATQFQAVAAGGLFAKVLGSAIVTLVKDSIPVDAGSYTPTATGVTNVASVGATSSHCYFRLETWVAVFGAQTITATGAGLTETRITLPIASALSASTQLVGAAAADRAGLTFTGFTVFADSTNDAAMVRARVSAGGTDFTVGYAFAYQILT